MNECEQISGNCTEGCHPQYFGGKCEHVCSLNCFSQENNQLRCSNIDGKCMQGCIDGFVGDFCQVLQGEMYMVKL